MPELLSIRVAKLLSHVSRKDVAGPKVEDVFSPENGGRLGVDLPGDEQEVEAVSFRAGAHGDVVCLLEVGAFWIAVGAVVHDEGGMFCDFGRGGRVGTWWDVTFSPSRRLNQRVVVDEESDLRREVEEVYSAVGQRRIRLLDSTLNLHDE